jgi:hypothetical protein
LQQIYKLKYVDLTLTVDGLGSRICLINNFAPGENQGGKEKSAAFIYRQTQNLSNSINYFRSKETELDFICLTLLQNGNMKGTFLYKVGRSVSSNGRYPAIKTNKITPHDHASAADPSYPSSLSTYKYRVSGWKILLFINSKLHFSEFRS